MRINTNISALNAHRQLGINTERGAGAMEKLSSGLRINRAGDDAAGLAISEKMRGQIRGLTQASRNAQDGISLIQTAEGALNETHSILQRMRELAVQSSTDTNTLVDREEIQKEIDQLAEEITRIAETTEFNTQNLMGGKIEDRDGNFTATFHIGANEKQNIVLEINDMSAKALKVGGPGKAEKGEGEPGAVSYVLTTGEITSGDLEWGTTSGTLTITPEGEGAIAITLDADYNDLDELAGVIETSLGGSGIEVEVVGDTLVFTGEEGFVIEGDLTAANGTAAIQEGEGASEPVEYIFTTGEITDLDFDSENGTVTVTPDEGTPIEINLNADYSDMDALATVINDELTASGIEVKVVGNTLVFTGEGAFSVSGDLGEGEATGGTGAGIDVSTQKAADKAITVINDAIETVSAERSKLGAMQNRLEHTIANLGTSAENLQAAESRIRDLDMAAEIMEFTKSNILNQAATAMLAQANMAPQTVLQLLG